MVFQLGHVLSDMEILVDILIVVVATNEFQLGHVLSDMEI